MNSFFKQGFYTIGTLKINHILCHAGIPQNYIYHYGDKLNGVENDVILISYPKDIFCKPQTLWTFLYSDISMNIKEILTHHQKLWGIEVYFRQCKTKLAFDQCQICTAQGIRKFRLLTFLVLPITFVV